MTQLLVNLNCGSTTPTVGYEDNQSLICIAKNPLLNERTKHIRIKHHFVCERIVVHYKATCFLSYFYPPLYQTIQTLRLKCFFSTVKLDNPINSHIHVNTSY